jgi:nucleoside-triphosphatase THEP1
MEGVADGGQVLETVQRPAGQAAELGAVVEVPDRVPWSQLGADFMQVWGRDRSGKFQPEHTEITGQTGSGKTYLLAKLLQQRAQLRGSQSIMVCTKQADATLDLLGWPIVDDWRGVRKYAQVIYWPRTRLQGEDREAFHYRKISDLLSRLWVPGANSVLAFDEVGYVEELHPRMRKTVRMYWREGRSQGITLLAMKQRPVGVARDQHSETRWKFVFPPADQGDMDRFAELLGRPRDWAPILNSLDQESHEFIVRNSVTKDSYISWIDEDLTPIPAQAQQRGYTAREFLFGREKVG